MSRRRSTEVRLRAINLPLLALAAAALFGQDQTTGSPDATYVLGPEDQLTMRVLDLEEVPDKPFRVDMRGNINVPLIGRVHAGGLTVEQLEATLTEEFSKVLNNATVTVSMAEFRSQPVSVLGAVRTPGVHQIRGQPRCELLSLAGGLNPDAGNTIKITRRKSAGPLPLANSQDDPTGEFQVAEVTAKSIMEGKNPQDNIQVLPNDVVSVPKAELVYVIGAVHKSGGFILSEKERVSVLQALSMAEGLDRGSAPGNAKILRRHRTVREPHGNPRQCQGRF